MKLVDGQITGTPRTAGSYAFIAAATEGRDGATFSAPNRIGREGGRMTKIWGLSKREAEYGTAPTPDVRCDKCKYMFPPLSLGGCRLVRGVISGSSSCKEFIPRRPADTHTASED
jgi:hypothetical protein